MRGTRTIAAAALSILSPVIAGTALAQTTAAELNLRALAATCANCHGTDGRAVEGQSMVRIAGMPREVMAAQMRAFRDGQRQATVMHQLAKGYSDAQIDALAAYFAARP